MMNDFRADMHCHSTCSDGSCTPEELIDLAVEVGLKGLAITDHDSIAAYDLAKSTAEEKGIDLVPGVEFSSHVRGISVHILAYGFPMPNPVLEELCQRHVERRRQRNTLILERLAHLGMPIDWEDLPDDGIIGRPHIGQAMVSKGYVENIKQAFNRFLGDNRPAYAVVLGPDAVETVDIIHEAGGLAVIAHPMLIKKSSVVKELLKLPFDGMECYYARFPAAQERVWHERAEECGWIVSGGSDFHGDVKPHISLGCSWVGQETFEKIKNQGRA